MLHASIKSIVCCIGRTSIISVKPLNCSTVQVRIPAGHSKEAQMLVLQAKLLTESMKSLVLATIAHTSSAIRQLGNLMDPPTKMHACGVCYALQLRQSRRSSGALRPSMSNLHAVRRLHELPAHAEITRLSLCLREFVALGRRWPLIQALCWTRWGKACQIGSKAKHELWQLLQVPTSIHWPDLARQQSFLIWWHFS